MNKLSVLNLLLIISLILCSCNSGCENVNPEHSDSAIVSIVNWNVQTFFDAELSGNEYKEFQSNARWSKDKYLVRLHRLCEVMNSLNADVYVFEELENEGILYDISNFLAGNSWDSKKILGYGCFTKENDSSIGTGIISRYPITEVKTHNVDIRSQKNTQPSVRPVLQAKLEVNGKALTVLACHWKSKSGGEEQSEIWRDWQEFLVAYCINNCVDNKNAFLICGDLNRDVKEFVESKSENGKSSNVIFRGEKTVELYSPWLNQNGSFATEIGSYYYNNTWERIDNFFACKELKVISFSPKAEEPWAKENKIPFKYSIYNGEGYSDHLPIICSVKF